MNGSLLVVEYSVTMSSALKLTHLSSLTVKARLEVAGRGYTYYYICKVEITLCSSVRSWTLKQKDRSCRTFSQLNEHFMISAK